MSYLQKHIPAVTFLLLFCFRCFSAEGNAAGLRPVTIDYFFEAGCADCYRVSNQVMPDLKERFEGFYVINSYDVGIKSNVVRLAAYQEKLNVVSNKPVMMVVDYRHVFNGFDAIEANLLRQVDECMAERQEPNWKAPAAIKVNDDGAVRERMRKITALIVVTAGFLDGLNPCAMASLIFFMSLLAVGGIRSRGLVIMGVSFCLASFATYTALGLGLLRTLHLFSGFPVLGHVADICMIIVLMMFALISFRDAWQFRKTGNPGDVIFQLPQNVKMRIHGIMKEGINTRNLILGGFVIGVLVTALESVCTGQMYVPILAVMAKSGMSGAWGYLLLYNVMFVVPLVTVFMLTCFGLSTPTLLEWSRKNVFVSKLLLGVFFLLLAGLLIIL